MDEWEEISLGECAKFQEGYVNPPQGKASYFDGPVRWLRAVDLNDGEVWNTSRTLTEFGFLSAGKAAQLFQPGTLAISKSGTIGRIGLLRAPMCGNRAVINIRPDVSRCNPRFIFYALLLGRPQIEILAEGSVQKNLYVSALSGFRFRLPPRAAQDAIANVLTSLDDKIELNRRMNETLEGMAQAIFRDWFVDFGPTRRKAAGEADPVAIMGGLTPDPARAAELAALFPAAFGDDGLPVGWTETAIGDLVKARGGATPSTGDETLWAPAEHYWATPKDLSNMSDLALFDTARQISDAGLAKITSGLLPVGSVLLSSRAPIGYLAIAQVPVAINQGFIGIAPTAELGSGYLYCWCKANLDKIVANANGSTFQEISKKNFRPITSPLPADRLIIAEFGNVVEPLFARLIAAAKENRTLAETRDYILPRLMSGAVRVKPVQARAG